MKINVTVDLEDLYDEYADGNGSSGNFNELILDEIRSRIKQEIWSEFRKTALDEFKAKVNAEFLKEEGVEVARIIKTVFSERKIRVKEATKNNPEPEMVTLFEYIQDKIEKDYFSVGNTAEVVLREKMNKMSENIEKSISTASTILSNEIKGRYDLLFASQLVAKMNQAGMLKEDVAKLLIEKE